MSSRSYRPFPNTHWSLVRRAGLSDDEARHKALTVLLERYRPALQSYLTAVRHLSASAAEDALQGFLADKLLQQRFLERADEKRGRFRTFVLTSLNHYLSSSDRSSRLRAMTSLNRSSERPSPSAAEPPAIVEAHWARVLILNVLHAMREECRKEGKKAIWAVFEGRVMREIFEGGEPAPYEKLAEDLHLQSPTQAANLLMTAKRMYARLLRKAIGEYENTESDISQEIAHLREILSRRGTRDQDS